MRLLVSRGEHTFLFFCYCSPLITTMSALISSLILMSRHGGAVRILSYELLGFKNLLSFASHISRVNRWLVNEITSGRLTLGSELYSSFLASHGINLWNQHVMPRMCNQGLPFTRLHEIFSWLAVDIFLLLEKISWEGEFTLRSDPWAGLIASCGSF